MTAREKVLAKWPDAEADGDESKAAIFVGMYQMSSWKQTEHEAWADAARRIEEEDEHTGA